MAGNSCMISFFNTDSMLFNGSHRLELSPDVPDIYDIQFVRQESDDKKTYLLMTTSGAYQINITRILIGKLFKF